MIISWKIEFYTLCSHSKDGVLKRPMPKKGNMFFGWQELLWEHYCGKWKKSRRLSHAACHSFTSLFLSFFLFFFLWIYQAQHRNGRPGQLLGGCRKLGSRSQHPCYSKWHATMLTFCMASSSKAPSKWWKRRRWFTISSRSTEIITAATSVASWHWSWSISNFMHWQETSRVSNKLCVMKDAVRGR